MTQMNAAVLLAPGKIEIQKRDKPTLRPNEVLVNIKACGICTFERRLFVGAKSIGYPRVAGHEASGVVVEVGSAVRRSIQVGSKVALDLLNRCGECDFCRSGRGNLCVNKFKGNLNVMGGFGEFVAVPSEQVFLMDDAVSFVEATLTEPIACCLRSLSNLQVKFGEDMLIYGAGPMGLIHLMLGKAMGLRVVMVEPSKRRRELAVKLGAVMAVDPSEVKDIPGSADVIVVTVALPEAVQSAMEIAAKGTRIGLYSSFADGATMPLDINKIHYSELKLGGAESRTPQDFNLAAKIVSRKMIDVKALISRTVSLSELAAALSEEPNPDTLRVVVTL